ncbi:MAG: leucine-rich repeat domain-containing protein [Candidatus Hodarchaeota archaeon]
MEYVILKGKKFKVKKGRLKINYKLIYEISEIKGLESLTNLEVLNLNSNFEISEISGVENLTNLKVLMLRNNNIKEIKGLENLTNLKLLDLAENNISEIKGLGSLINLEYLDLTANKISEIKNLETLKNLKFLFIGRNKIPTKLLNFLGGLSQDGKALNTQRFVEYSHEKKRELVERKIVLSCPFCRIRVKTLGKNDDKIICSNCGSKYEKEDLIRTEE